MLTERDTASTSNVIRALPRNEWFPTWLITLGIGILALLPRCLGLNDFMTIDEPYHWIGRVRRFAAALASGDWAATNQTGHPGVTTMWLGSLGRWLGTFAGLYDGGRTGNSVEYLAMLRLPLAVVNSFAVVLGYLLLRRLLRPTTATLAAVLWATSPFLVAHSRLLHLDGLLTSFMALSVLALLVAMEDRRPETGDQRHETENKQLRSSVFRPRWLIASGVFAGLALLTKAPSLLLLPIVGLLLLAAPAESLRKRVSQTLTCYAIWLIIAVVVLVVGWPAMWVAPIDSLGSMIGEVLFNGGQAEPAGNYFMGQPVADPGWLFYPAVVLWRNTPVTLLGLVIAPFALRRRSEERRVLLSLAVFVFCFAIALSIEPKKFDRYLLPVWPAFEILAAAGLVQLGAVLASWWTKDEGQKTKTGKPFVLGLSSFVPITWILIILGLAANLLWYQPYYLAYYNPLLGGGTVAQRVMFVGWGEGMERVGAWLSTRPDLHRGPVLSWIGPTLSPFVPEQVLDLQPQFLHRHGSYAVLYSRSVQRDENPVAEAYVKQTAPLYTLRMYGIEYATVYQLPRPFDQPLDAAFGNGLHLRGLSQTKLDNTLVITPSWDIQADQPGGRFTFLHLLAADGTKVAQVDAPLDEGMFSSWQAGQQFGSPLVLPLPTNLPAGVYRVVMGVYEPPTGARLPLARGPSLPPDVDGPDALLLTTVTIHS